MELSNNAYLGKIKILMLKGERGETGHGALVARSAAEMVDINQIYVYAGSENGYTFGNWYFWNGSAWTSGGAYNAVVVDTDDTLTLANEAADAKAVGDAIWGANNPHTNRTPTPYVHYTPPDELTHLVDMPIGSWKLIAVGDEETNGTLKKMLTDAGNFPWVDNLGKATFHYRVSRVLTFGDKRSNITLEGLSGGPRYVGQTPAGATDDESITWTNRSVTSDFTLAGAIASAKSVGDLVWGANVPHDTRVPTVPMRYTAINGEITIADIPDYSHYSISGARFLELFNAHGEGEPEPFQYADEILNNTTYYMEKKLEIVNPANTVYMFLLYRLPRTTVYAGYISLNAAQTPANIHWNRIITPVDASLSKSGYPADALAVRNFVESGGKSVSILVFGNSYSFSDLGLVPALLNEFGLGVTMGILYKGGQTVTQHISFLDNDTEYPYYCECDGARWTNTAASASTKPSAVLARRHWDYIVIQQPTTVELQIDKVGELADKIVAKINYPVSFLYNQPHIWGANDESLDSATIPGTSTPIPGSTDEQKSNEQFLIGADFSETLLAGDTILHVLPCGAAVQNARQLDAFKAIGVEGYLCYDQTSHLQNGIATLIPAYAAALKICEMLGIKQKVFKSQISPTNAWLNNYNLFTAPSGIVPHGSSEGVTDANKLAAAKCAIMAWKHPYNVFDESGLTVTSVEGANVGKTEITVAGYLPCTNEEYVYKLGTTAPFVRCGQTIGDGWSSITFPAVLTPGANMAYITVAVKGRNGIVQAYGSVELSINTGEET